MRYQPLHARIICEPFDDGRVTKGGIVIPDAVSHHKHLAFATVLSIGTGRVNAEGKTVPLTVKIGDVIAYPRKAAAVLPLVDDHGEETSTLMIEEAHVVAIVHDMPRDTGLTDLAGKSLLAMRPVSLAKADSSYQNIDEMDRAKHAGWDDSDAVDES
jgi:chaperonin GroES